MIIQCDKCFTKFRIDDAKVTGAGVKVRCTKCQNVFIAAPPLPPVEKTPSSPLPEEKPEEKKEADFGFEQQDQPPEPSGFGADTGGADFSSDSLREGAQGEKRAAGTEAAGSFQADTSLNFDIEGTMDTGGEKPREQETAGGGFNFGEMESSFGSPAPEQKQEPEEKEETGGWNLPTEEKTGEAEPPLAEPKREAVVAPVASVMKDVPAPAFDATKGMAEKDELESFAEGGPADEPLDETGDTAQEPGAPKKAHPTAPGKTGFAIGIIIVFAVVIAGAVLYLSGVFSPARTHIAKNTMDIEAIIGSFVDNKNAGRLFVIQAKIKNLTGSPQTVHGVRGIIYGAKGEQLATLVVAPGRTLPEDDLKNLSREEIQKAFKDSSGGVIPARGSAPAMVVFTDLPQGMAEFGMDVIR